MRMVAAGDVLLQEGDEGDSLLVVATGSLTLIRGSKAVGQLTLGDCFGEQGVLGLENKRTGTLYAQRLARVYELPRRHLVKTLQNHPQDRDELTRLAAKKYKELQDSLRRDLHNRASFCASPRTSAQTYTPVKERENFLGGYMGSSRETFATPSPRASREVPASPRHRPHGSRVESLANRLDSRASTSRRTSRDTLVAHRLAPVDRRTSSGQDRRASSESTTDHAPDFEALLMYSDPSERRRLSSIVADVDLDEDEVAAPATDEITPERMADLLRIVDGALGRVRPINSKFLLLNQSMAGDVLTYEGRPVFAPIANAIARQRRRDSPLRFGDSKSQELARSSTKPSRSSGGGAGEKRLSLAEMAAMVGPQTPRAAGAWPTPDVSMHEEHTTSDDWASISVARSSKGAESSFDVIAAATTYRDKLRQSREKRQREAPG